MENSSTPSKQIVAHYFTSKHTHKHTHTHTHTHTYKMEIADTHKCRTKFKHFGLRYSRLQGFFAIKNEKECRKTLFQKDIKVKLEKHTYGGKIKFNGSIWHIPELETKKTNFKEREENHNIMS